MMVTFISQCEKKSLNKTRRVLDAFANRIGDNTWQTVITQEGLQAVKKLLRKTASKNTAVSCFWIRSRARSELVWVVGNKDKFNGEGVVPVNSTNKIDVLKMDELNVNIESYYANTKKQPLDQHLFAVGYVAYLLCKELIDDENLAHAVFVAGCWHDMGKNDPGFQAWLEKELKKKGVLDVEIPEDGQHEDKKSKNYPRHNEVSLLLFNLLNEQKFNNSKSKKYVEHAIYWHHDRWFRGAEKNGQPKGFSLDMVKNKVLEKVGLENINKMYTVTRALTEQINNLSKNYLNNDSMLLDKACSTAPEDRLSDLEEARLPKYKTYSEKLQVKEYQANILENTKNSIARTTVVSAD